MSLNDKRYFGMLGGSPSPNSPTMNDLQYFGVPASSSIISPNDLLNDLRNANPSDTPVRFLVAKNAVGDNLGGFYRWDATSTASEDTQYLNVVASSLTSTGRWVRVFQKAKTYAQGVLVNNGGIRTLYAPAVTDSNGQVAINLTDDNTLTGNNLFSEIWQVTPQQNPTVALANAPIMGSAQASGDLKKVTCIFHQNNSTTLGATLLAIAGTVIKGLTPVPANVSVLVKIEGI